MVPIRGQMIRVIIIGEKKNFNLKLAYNLLYKVKAPWIKHYYYTDDNCYIIPK